MPAERIGMRDAREVIRLKSNNLPQRQPVEPYGEGRERRHQRKADDDRKDPHYFRAARHRFALSPIRTPRAKKQRGARRQQGAPRLYRRTATMDSAAATSVQTSSGGPVVGQSQ